MSKAVLTEYELRASGLTLPLKVALVADLHERPADDILKLLQNAKPDLLAIAGDTLERCGENGSDASQTPYPCAISSQQVSGDNVPSWRKNRWSFATGASASPIFSCTSSTRLTSNIGGRCGIKEETQGYVVIIVYQKNP